MIPKFRASIIGLEKLIEVNKIFFSNSGDIYINNYPGQDFYLMQSTGLHDENGVEIFEGDIVKYSDYEYSFTGIVTQDTVTCWWIKGIDPDDNFNFDDVTDYSEYTCDVKVIGNVHQHHELLEDV